jgi:MFS superfamily sulfate permease-like transporter
LFFANADAILSKIARDSASDPAARAVVVSLEESYDLDSTALEAILEFDTTIRASGRTIRYARVHDRIRDLFAMTDAGPADRCSFSVDDAVSEIEASNFIANGDKPPAPDASSLSTRIKTLFPTKSTE